MKPRLAALVLLLSAVTTAAQPPGVRPADAAKADEEYLRRSVLGQRGQARPADPALAPVPTDSFLFVSVKVSKLWDNPAAKPLRDYLAKQEENPFGMVVGLEPAEVDRVTLFVPAIDRRGPGEPLVLVTTRQPYNEAKVLKSLGVGKGGDRPGRVLGGRAVEIDNRPFRWVVFADDRTLLFMSDRGASESGPGLIGQLIARKPDGPLAPALLAAQTHDVTMSLDVQALARAADNERGMPRELAPYLVLLQAKTATLTADAGQTAKGQLTLTFPDAATAKRAAPVLGEGIKAVTELMTAEATRAGDRDPIPKFIAGQMVAALKAAKVTAAGNDVVASADVPYSDELSRFVATLPKSLKLARSTAEAKNNLKQLALGLHNMESAYASLPGDVAFGNPPAPMSWRVQILPFVEQDNLFRRLDMMKPWDDPANLKILEAAEMPKVFEIPGRPAPKGHTYFRVISLPKNAKGNDRPFFEEGKRGPRFADITDGLSNTFMIVEAGEAVPWYKPDVLAYDGKLPLPQLGAKDADSFLVAMGDGSVRELRPSKLNEQTLRALITRAGGEVVPALDR